MSSLAVGRASSERGASSTRTSAQRPVTYSAVVVLILATMFPFLWLLQMSLKTEVAMFEMPPKLVFAPSLRNYADVLTGDFLRSFRNSTVASVATTIVSLLVGVPAAYGLARARFRSDNLISYWVLGTRMAPPIAFAIPFFLAYRQMGLIDTVPGLIIIYLTFNLSLVIWMMRTFFEGLPRSLEEAAYIDGASHWQAFWRIIFPLVQPMLVAQFIFGFIGVYNEYILTSVLIGDPDLYPLGVGVRTLATQYNTQWTLFCAAAVLGSIPILVVFFLLQRFLVEGLTRGAVKG